jgi:hypothetical protein
VSKKFMTWTNIKHALEDYSLVDEEMHKRDLLNESLARA